MNLLHLLGTIVADSHSLHQSLQDQQLSQLQLVQLSYLPRPLKVCLWIEGCKAVWQLSIISCIKLCKSVCQLMSSIDTRFWIPLS